MSQHSGWGSYYDKLRDRPPRRTVLAALEAFGERHGARAIDLGCGDGRDVVEMARRCWHVMAVDREPEALNRLRDRGLSGVTPIESHFEDVPMPVGVEFVNSSFAMPLCEPERFHDLWRRIREALPAGGRFSGQWYGPRDSWVGRPGITCLSRAEALALLADFALELFEEEETSGVTPRGTPKHWHIFHIVARKR
jgi:SAM-dependent methyltransferase